MCGWNIPFMLYTIYFSFFSVVMVVGWRKSRFNLVEGLFFESFFEVLPRCMKFPFLINAISMYHQPTKEKENTFLTLYAKSNTCRSFSNLNISILCSNACALYRPKKMYTCNAIRLRERLTPST